MAKLSFLLFAAFLLVAAEASIHHHRTIVTTTEVEEADDSNNNQGSMSQRCREQMRRTYPESCERYMRSMMRQYGYSGNQQGEERMELQRCCQQLRQIEDEQCRCQALQQIMMRHQEEFQGQEMREMMERARRIPQVCGLRSCQIRQSW